MVVIAPRDWKPLKRHADEVRPILSPAEQADEERLRTAAWFPYRLIDDAVERTCLFVHAYSRTALRFVARDPEIVEDVRALMKSRGSYLRPSELAHPWAEERGNAFVPSRKWSSYVKARRLADEHGVDYENWCSYAIVSSFDRGRGRIPRASELGSDKLVGAGPSADKHEATILNYVRRRYEAEVPFVDGDPFFRAPAYVQHPVQKAYLRHVAQHVLAQRGGATGARRFWTMLQREGRVPSTITFDDALG